MSAGARDPDQSFKIQKIQPAPTVVSGPLGTASIVQNGVGYSSYTAVAGGQPTAMYPEETGGPIAQNIPPDEVSPNSNSEGEVIAAKLSGSGSEKGVNVNNIFMAQGGDAIEVMGSNVQVDKSGRLVIGDLTITPTSESLYVVGGATISKGLSMTLANGDVLLVNDAGSIVLHPKTGGLSKTSHKASTSKSSTPSETSKTKADDQNNSSDASEEQNKKKSMANKISTNLKTWIAFLLFQFAV
jgi:hypothetical protein